MKLTDRDAELFFKLMWGLQYYVNQQRKILEGVDSIEDYVSQLSTEKIKVRDALWQDKSLLDDYVAHNPDNRLEDELEIVRKWKGAVQGAFYIFSHLKKHSILIGRDSQVYAVLGLYDSLEDILYGRPLPAMVNTVLLPFKGQIVYDGLMSGYNVFFGGGIRSSLKENYMKAKQNGRIITTLEDEPAKPATRDKPAQDWRPVIDTLVQNAEGLKGGSPVQAAALGLLRASARLTQAAAHHPDDLGGLWNMEQQVRKALTRLQKVLARTEA